MLRNILIKSTFYNWLKKIKLNRKDSTDHYQNLEIHNQDNNRVIYTKAKDYFTKHIKIGFILNQIQVEFVR